jgi:hypothetical protein
MPNQPLNESQLQALLRLKRYEQPPAGYFNDLLESVHRRQREEMLRRPAWQIALERIRAFFAPLHLDWRHAGSMAALLVVGIFAIRVAIPDRAANSQMTNIISDSSLPASSHTSPVITLEPGSAPSLAAHENPRVQRDPDAPVRFIIDTQPVSYETNQIRF